MKANKNKEPIMRKLNFRESGSSDVLSINPEDIPTLVPADRLSILQDGDTDPYYKIQEIEYPIVANGWTYRESFFEEFINKLNERAFPGSKSGHSTNWGENPPTDLFLVGAKMEKNGDGSGKVYFKNYIPKKFDSDNESFIRMAKAGMVHFSLVSYTRDEILVDGDGNRSYNVVGSEFGERNDAVEFDTGAMDQKTNSGKSGGDSEENREVEKMDAKELLANLKTLKANAEISVDDVVAVLGVEVVGDVHRNAVSTVESLGGLIEGDLIEGVKALQNEIKQNAAAVEAARMTEEFGAEKNEDGSDNLLRVHANALSEGMADLSMDERIEKIKENKITQKLAGERADVYSEENVLSGKSNKRNSGSRGKRKTVTM